MSNIANVAYETILLTLLLVLSLMVIKIIVKNINFLFDLLKFNYLKLRYEHANKLITRYINMYYTRHLKCNERLQSSYIFQILHDKANKELLCLKERQLVFLIKHICCEINHGLLVKDLEIYGAK